MDDLFKTWRLSFYGHLWFHKRKPRHVKNLFHWFGCGLNGKNDGALMKMHMMNMRLQIYTNIVRLSLLARTSNGIRPENFDFLKSIWWFLLWLTGKKWKYFLPLEWRWLNFNGRLLHCRWLSWTPRCVVSSIVLLLPLPLLFGIYLLIQSKTIIKYARIRDTWFFFRKYP